MLPVPHILQSIHIDWVISEQRPKRASFLSVFTVVLDYDNLEAFKEERLNNLGNFMCWF